jgi:hypothetical protein
MISDTKGLERQKILGKEETKGEFQCNNQWGTVDPDMYVHEETRALFLGGRGTRECLLVSV